jgi:hypothetical protein
MIKRTELVEEELLRENIRKAIKRSIENRFKVFENFQRLERIEEHALRKVIRKMIIQEKTAVGDEVPHEKTGINVLRKTLKKIIPVIRDDYLNLTTDVEQRTSYMAHLINGVDNLLAPIETNIDAPDLNSTAIDEEISIDLGDKESEDTEMRPDEMIDLGDEILPGLEVEEEPEPDDDAIALDQGMESAEHDQTGRNVALSTFKQIQSAIVTDFGELANDEDRELYHDYLKTNILLWRDKFEEVLSVNLPVPTTPEYEKEKTNSEVNDDDELFEFEILD